MHCIGNCTRQHNGCRLNLQSTPKKAVPACTPPKKAVPAPLLVCFLSSSLSPSDCASDIKRRLWRTCHYGESPECATARQRQLGTKPRGHRPLRTPITISVLELTKTEVDEVSTKRTCSGITVVSSFDLFCTPGCKVEPAARQDHVCCGRVFANVFLCFIWVS